MIGQTLSHYRVVAKLGEGGMGVVYEAEDIRLHRHVALKFLPAEHFDDQAARERFEREARAASALTHPHICTVHDIAEHEGQPFIVMELLKGSTLKDRIGSRPLPFAEILKIGREVADALDAAHRGGSSTGTSSPPTSSSRSAEMPRCWTSAWPSSGSERLKRAPAPTLQPSRS